jgi:Ser/Thr protein kinase RdoA (MazF antagonist)
LTALPVIYATAPAEAVAAFVAAHYALDGPAACTFVNRGFNDAYALRDAGGAEFILRLSGPRARGPADVAAETAFIAYLDAAGVPVAAPVTARTGALFTAAPLPGGPCPAVLFHLAQGRRPDLDGREDAAAQGRTLARLHDATDRYPARKAGRFRLDLDHLLHRPAAAVMALDLDAPAARRDFMALAARLETSVLRVDAALTRTRCHGDTHGLNARIATAGRYAGQAVFFDFDDGGWGYLAYDLAVHLWAQVSFGRRRQAMWHAFRAAYGAERPVTPADEAALPVFVAVRHIWLMGEFAAQTALWGTETLSAAWLAREVAFLLAWERDMLAPALL